MEEELHPVPSHKSAKSPRRKSSGPTMDINVLGRKVSVPMTKTVVGHARPLPAIPNSLTM